MIDKMVEETKLPIIISLNDYGGDYQAYVDVLYSIFENDFLKHHATFGSHTLRHKFNPAFQNRSYTFYHMTHKGEKEDERTPDLRRCERLPWARPTIENVEMWNLKCWAQERNGKQRICIWLEVDTGDNYYVVLDVRKDYVLLWTAFYAEYSHQVHKKRKEYDEWLAGNGGKEMSPDELVAAIQDKIS